MRRAVFVAVTAAAIATAYACSTFEEGAGGDGAPDASGDAPTNDGPSDLDVATGDAATEGGVLGERFTKISAGGDSACVIRNEQVFCWGDNRAGAVGQGADEPCLAPDAGTAGAGDAGTCRPVARLVAGLENEKVVEVGVGWNQACARTADHELYCWGSNATLRLGVSALQVPTFTATPTKVPIPPAYSMSVGNGVVCARVLVEGRMEGWCWGYDSDGQLGRGMISANDASAAPSREPARIAWDANIDEIETSGYTACARSGGEVRCWGVNVLGALGHAGGTAGDVACPYVSGTNCNATPVRVETPSGTSFRSIELVGNYFACGVDDVGPRCWGLNYNGTLGQGSDDTAAHPQPATANAVIAAAPMVKNLRGKHTHACALAGNAEVWCWGVNIARELGHVDGTMCGSAKCEPMPRKVQSLPPIAELAVGEFFNVALAEDGRLFAWGTNFRGRLGHLPGSKGDEDCSAVAEALPAAKCNAVSRAVDFQ